MRKLLVWTLRLVLLLLTPLLLFCTGVARSILWLDAWAAEQLATDSVMTFRGQRLVRSLLKQEESDPRRKQEWLH
jgi:hypothetical protein